MKKYIFTLGSSLALLAACAMPVSALAYSYNNAYYPQQNYSGYYNTNTQYQYPLLYGPTSYSQYQQYSYYQQPSYNYDYQQQYYQYSQPMYYQPTYYPSTSYYYPQQTYYGNYQPYNVGGYNISYSYPNVYTHGW